MYERTNERTNGLATLFDWNNYKLNLCNHFAFHFKRDIIICSNLIINSNKLIREYIEQIYVHTILSAASSLGPVIIVFFNNWSIVDVLYYHIIERGWLLSFRVFIARHSVLPSIRFVTHLHRLTPHLHPALHKQAGGRAYDILLIKILNANKYRECVTWFAVNRMRCDDEVIIKANGRGVSRL